MYFLIPITDIGFMACCANEQQTSSSTLIILWFSAR